jgi:hypothetical protein
VKKASTYFQVTGRCSSIITLTRFLGFIVLLTLVGSMTDKVNHFGAIGEEERLRPSSAE